MTTISVIRVTCLFQWSYLHIRIIDCRIETIEADTLRERRGGTNWILTIINTTIGTWHPQRMDTFESITIANSSIGTLMSGGINVTRPEADDCGKVNETVSVRITRSSITTLHQDGIVLEVANGRLEFENSRIMNLTSGGVRLAFRARFTVTGSRIDRLSAGALCQVCSDIVHLRDNALQPLAPEEAALSFGSSACRERCPRQRLHLRLLDDISLLSCDAADQLLEHLRRCRLRQPLVTACGGGEGGGSCGDLRLLADKADCPVNFARLLQLMEPSRWWTEPGVGGVGAAGLMVGFLLGLLMFHVHRRRRRRRPVATKESSNKESSIEMSSGVPPQPSPAMRRGFRRFREVSSRIGRVDSSTSSNNANAGRWVLTGAYDILKTAVHWQNMAYINRHRGNEQGMLDTRIRRWNRYAA